LRSAAIVILSLANSLQLVQLRRGPVATTTAITTQTTQYESSTTDLTATTTLSSTVDRSTYTIHGTTTSVTTRSVTGAAPLARFGHSCTLLPHLTKEDETACTVEYSLLVAGGSNGSELLMIDEDVAGRDLRDVWLLTLSAKACHDGSLTFISQWKVLIASSSGILPPLNSIGRCHSAELVDKNIIFFGGGAKFDHYIQILDVTDIPLRPVSV
jgi:hypothetical protein